MYEYFFTKSKLRAIFTNSHLPKAIL